MTGERTTRRKPTARATARHPDNSSAEENGVLDLQHQVGNRAVSALVTAQPSMPVSTRAVQRWTTNPLYVAPPPKAAPVQDPIVKLRALAKDKKLKPELISVVLESATQPQRDAIAADKKLMAAAKKQLGKQAYLDLLVALRMFLEPSAKGKKKGQSAHTSASKADELIQDKLAAYVGEAVKAGKKVSGQVAVVGDADWKIAYDEEFGDDGEEKETNAFVDQKGRIIIHRDRGNPGTTIHEGTHKYSEDTLLSTYGFNFNEGVTELFTRKITATMKPPVVRANYQENFDFVSALEKKVGEKAIADAYFGGDLKKLTDAFCAKGGTEDGWKAIVADVKAGEWDDAEDAL